MKVFVIVLRDVPLLYVARAEVANPVVSETLEHLCFRTFFPVSPLNHCGEESPKPCACKHSTDDTYDYCCLRNHILSSLPLYGILCPPGRIGVGRIDIAVNEGFIEDTVVVHNVSSVVSVMRSCGLRPHWITFFVQAYSREKSRNNVGSPVSLRGVFLHHLIELWVSNRVFSIGQILVHFIGDTDRPRTVEVYTHQCIFLTESSSCEVHCFSDCSCIFDIRLCHYSFTPIISRAAFISCMILAPSLTSSVLPVTSQSAMFASMSSRKPSRSRMTNVYSSYSNILISCSVISSTTVTSLMFSRSLASTYPGIGR
nr:MAG TPA: hypothetical protein [Caudoviricetes sp.]